MLINIAIKKSDQKRGFGKKLLEYLQQRHPWDDIHLNEQMRVFWENVTDKKIDVTKYGHVTGTGIINFSKDMEIILK